MKAKNRKTRNAERAAAARICRELRERHGLTQQAAADRIGVHIKTWQSWEQEIRTPVAAVRRQLAAGKI